MSALFDKGLALSKEQFEKQKLNLAATVGLGKYPNIIPRGEPDVNAEPRTVWIGWHPVPFAGKWFAEQTGLGKQITSKINNFPDPTQHWAVIVGDYCHELWMDEKLDIIYVHERLTDATWTLFEVGKTTFNDEALRQTGELCIQNMRDTKPVYNPISNNCQDFAMLMLDAVDGDGAVTKLGTSSAIFNRVKSASGVKDLFKAQDTQALEADPTVGIDRQNTVLNAKKVMDENTKTVESKKFFFF